MVRTAWAAALVAAVAVGALGNSPVWEAIGDLHGVNAVLLQPLSEFALWQIPSDLDSDYYISVGAKVVVLLGVVFGLGYLSGRSDSPAAAFLAAWGSVLVAAGAAGGAQGVAIVALDLQQGPDQKSMVVAMTQDGGTFALYVGWLVGIAVLIAHRSEDRRGGPIDTSFPSLPPSTQPPAPRPQQPPPLDPLPGAGTTPPSPAWPPEREPLPARRPIRPSD